MASKAALILLGIMIVGCNNIESKNVEDMDMKVTTKYDQCQICHEFVTKAVFLLDEYKTRTEIIETLNQECSNLRPFDGECILVVDHYAPIFFDEIANGLRPELLCEKFGLCIGLPLVHLIKHENPCTLCQNAVNEVLTKLEDPEMQLEVIQILIKACNKAEESFAQRCKKLVLEYGPIILANTGKFLEKTDICTAIHACKAQKVTDVAEQQFLSASA